MAKRIWTEEEIKVLIQENDKVLYGALKKLNGEQTKDEQQSGQTKHYNALDLTVQIQSSCQVFPNSLSKGVF